MFAYYKRGVVTYLIMFVFLFLICNRNMGGILLWIYYTTHNFSP